MAFNPKKSIFYKNIRALYKVNSQKPNEVHLAVIDALFNTFAMQDGDIDQAKLEMCLTTATGAWLDLWGTYFAVPRDGNESDSDYSARIIEEILAPKVTIPALQTAAARWLNRKYGENYIPSDIIIFEPWRFLIMPDKQGELDSDFRLWSDDYWRYAVIDISLPDMSQFTMELISYLNEIKAAGVQIVWSHRPQFPVVPSFPDDDPFVWDHTILYTEPFVRDMDRMFFLDHMGNDWKNSPLDDCIENPLDGFIKVWGCFIDEYIELPPVGVPIRVHERAQLTSLFDFSHVLEEDYANVTIADAIALQDQNAIDRDNGLNGAMDERLQPWDIIELPEDDIYSVLVNNPADEDSPIIQQLIADNLIVLAPDSRRHFKYEDNLRRYNLWLSFDEVTDRLGMTKSGNSLSDLYNGFKTATQSLVEDMQHLDIIVSPIEVVDIP